MRDRNGNAAKMLSGRAVAAPVRVRAERFFTVKSLDSLRRSVMLVSVLVAAVLWAGTGTVAAQDAPDCSAVSYNGAGTDANPYEVSNLDQLQCIEDNDLDASYVLVSDIDASETASWNDGSGFEPVGGGLFDDEEIFTGTLYGGNHKITGLTINRSNEEGNIGLLNTVYRGKVTNISVVDVDITGYRYVGGLVGNNVESTIDGSYATGSINGSDWVGGIAGQNFVDGKITESYATGSVSGSGHTVGGLVGENDDGTIEESYADVSVNGSSVVGGLVGVNRGGTSTISMSYATGPVSGSEYVGGLVGLNRRYVGLGTVKKSYSTGAINGSELVGGLAGENEGTISGSYATGSVNGSTNVGGLAGSNRNKGTVKQSYATGSVNGSRRVGGLIGYNYNNFNRGAVSGSYAVGSVDGTEFVGGLVGQNYGGKIEKSYSNGSVNGSIRVGGLVGLNEAIAFEGVTEGIVRESYATGEVNGSRDVGGLVGSNEFRDSEGEITNSYWDKQATGQPTSAGGTGLTTAQMTGEAARGNMAGFDFTWTWKTVPGDYPELREGIQPVTIAVLVVFAALTLLTIVAVADRRRRS